MEGIMDKAKLFVADKIVHLEKPEADLTWISVKDVSREGVELESDVLITNPYDHDLPICEITFSLRSDKREIISGRVPDPGSIKANNKTAVKIPTKVPYDILLSIVRDIGSDWDVDYDLDVGLIVDIPIIGNLTIPLSKKGSFKLPSLSDIF